MEILHLTLKKKWFDMIKSGENKEEYRDIKLYWVDRLVPNRYDIIKFRNGYSKNAPYFFIELKDIAVGNGLTQWGAEKDRKYFILHLGKIIDNEKMEE